MTDVLDQFLNASALPETKRGAVEPFRPLLIETYFLRPDMDAERLATACGMTVAEVIEQMARRGLPIRYQRQLLPPYGEG